MRLGVSTLAWAPEEEPGILSTLGILGVDGLELAPAKYWPDLFSVPDVQVRERGAWYSDHGFTVSSLQAFFFGRPDLQLFTTASAFRSFMLRVMDIGQGLGVKHLVFGAPKNRLIPEGMDREAAWAFAVKEFSFLGRQALARGMFLGIEANPEVYGGNFLVSQSEVLNFVGAVDSLGVRWHLDTGALALTGESLFPGGLSFLGSLHVSEPRLAGFSTPWVGHVGVADYLKGSGVAPVLEMLPAGWEAVKEAVDFMRRVYG